MSAKRPLRLLHTAPVHIATCDALLAELAPEIAPEHTVRADLLAAAVAAGGLTEAVEAEAAAALRRLAAGAGAVLCTCSTVGPAAWRAAADSAVPVLRIDEAMAEAAVRAGARVGLAACLDTTLAPTRALLERVAAREGRPLEPRLIRVPEAWPLFEAGDLDGYAERIASALRAAARDSTLDVVVLAQASMAPAAARAGLDIPVLSSPRPGIAAAAEAWRRQHA